MRIWRWLLYSLALYMALVGMWDHQWRLILAGLAVWVIYPLISTEIHDVPVCTGCTRYAFKPGCPVHDPQERRAA